jgi:carboxylesterase type B
VAKYEESKRHEANQGLATHASELPSVFHSGTLLIKHADRQMADVMTVYWGNFLISEKGNTNEKHVGNKHLLIGPVFHADSD